MIRSRFATSGLLRACREGVMMGSEATLRRAVWIVVWLVTVIVAVVLYAIDRTGASRVLVYAISGCLFFVFGSRLERPVPRH